MLEVLDAADRELTVELLDILLGFSIGASRRRKSEFQRGTGRIDAGPEAQWILDLRASLVAELPRLRQLAAAPDAEIAGFADSIVSELAVSCDETGVARTATEVPFGPKGAGDG